MNISITETDNEVIVSFPFDNNLINRAKKVYPYKWDKTSRTWHYPILIREEVYNAFSLSCPPKRNRASFLIEEKPSSFLLKHQVQCLDIARNNPKYGFYLSTGTGKTVVAGEILKHKKSKAIIVAPLSTLRTVWERILNEFYPEIKYINLYSFNKEDREKIIKKDNSVHILNYEAFKIHYESILSAGYKCLIVDESSKLKGVTTQISKKLVKFSQQIESAYLLSGTPSPNSRMELYPQIDALSPGLLGYNFYSFRNHYFHALDRNGFKWAENLSTMQDFINRLRKVSISIRKEDCLDLPDKTYELREVEMTPEQSRIYKQMKNQLVADIGDITVVSPTVLTKIMRLRQITSGFIYHNDGSLRFSDSKFKVLNESLEEIGDNQIIIWAVFKEEVRKLLDMIPNSAGVYGDISQDEKSANIEDFKNGKYQYLIANPASMAHGQTLVNASYSIYYSLDWSGELWEQSNDRIYRYGQKNQCTYIILCCANTIDTIIYKKLQTKIEDSREIMNHLKQN